MTRKMKQNIPEHQFHLTSPSEWKKDGTNLNTNSKKMSENELTEKNIKNRTLW